jgi:RimJ/RimL family protein N-acetyltransferase
MLAPVVLDTPRLRLRQWRETDREPFAALNADSRVMEFFPSTLDRTASDAVVDILQSHIADHGYGFWAAELRDSGETIGFIGIQVPRAQLPFSPCVEIGWRLAHRFWGHGYASEGARASLRAGFETLNLSEIVSFTAANNIRSLAVMRRLNMQEDPVTFEHPNVPPGSPLRVHRLYRLTRGDWLQNRK